ncbi:TfuA-like protein [Roseibium sp. MMSF_3544]|uniref:TfuA-like protein n=1 Tax=unclassified Roseibium TaxID=2629323 RepID=UPI00273FD205|nr:TfuA-like protein [Roseibium sp. MMSF_3544]
MKVVLFIGPSLPEEIQLPDGVELRPPAAAGDVFRAVRRGANLIALVDARFQDFQTVQHKEILYALEQGVHVWGAASMGALRAVECDTFGMLGFGKIYRDYRDGVLVDDHEVAVQHGPEELGYPALNEPLVNVRATLSAAENADRISSKEITDVLKVAAKIPYTKLTWPVLCDAVEPATLALRLREISEQKVDAKKSDAAELINALGDALTSGLSPFQPTFDLQRTHHWKALEARYSTAEDGLSEIEQAVLDELRLDPVRYRNRLLRAFARRASMVQRPEADLQLIEGLRTDLGLGTASAFHEWLTANETTEAELGAFLSSDEALEEALDRTAHELAPALLDELRADNLFEDYLARAEAKAELLGDRRMAVPAAFADFDLRDLLDWFCQSRRLALPTDDADDLARSLGLSDRTALHRLLRREFERVRAREDAA